MLLLMNFVDSAHAECIEASGCADMQIVKSVADSGDNSGDTKKIPCDCCATCSHHSHMIISKVKTELVVSDSETLHTSSVENFYSKLYFPPSKPPKV